MKLMHPLLATALAIAMGAMSSSQAADKVEAIVGASIVDVINGRTIPNGVLVIEGERIKAAGPASSVTVPAGADVIHADGKFLLPGLTNMHVHLGLKLPGAAGDSLTNETDVEEVLRMAGNARLSLLSGCTTLRLVGEDHGTDFALRRAIDSGEVMGPRIKTAGEVIIPTGGHGSMEADGPYGFAHVVRKQIKDGADWIKIAISGGISDSHGDISAAPMTDEEMSILIEVAHRNGIKVTAHNGSSVAAHQAMKFGIDGFEHGYHLDMSVLREMKAKGVWLVPTMVVSQPGALEFYHKIGSPPWYLERVKSTGVDHWNMLQNAIKLGVNIALGTDQYPFEPNDGTTATIAEAELYVKAGMTPAQSLRSATIDAARMIDMNKDIGSLEPGKYADVVALTADPLQDIHALRTLGFVMKGGTIVRDDWVPKHN